MKQLKAREVRVFVIILVMSLVFSVLANVAIDALYKWVYPDKYHDIVAKYSAEYSVPKELVFAVIKVESDFDENAVSSANAIGLMQMLPSTYRWLTTILGDEYLEADLYVPETNIKYGTYYLSYLYSRFGSWEKALIAYNWGEGNFSIFLENEGYTEGDYDSIPVGQTKHYVQKVIHHWEKYEEIY